jgi:hypothetical protein
LKVSFIGRLPDGREKCDFEKFWNLFHRGKGVGLERGRREQ